MPSFLASRRSSFLFLVCLLPCLCLSFDLTSHCTSLDTPNECPCSRRELFTSLNFCLTSMSNPSTCRQRPCTTRYVCDCTGDTLCRAVSTRTTLTCAGPVAADGTCECLRRPSMRVAGAPAPSELVPLRPIGPLRAVSSVLPPSTSFCSERPAFWASMEGAKLLGKQWGAIASGSAQRGMMSRPLLQFGHVGHFVSFSSSRALSDALLLAGEEHKPVSGEFEDPAPGPAINRLTSECLAASVSLRLASRGVATRRYAMVMPFDMADRMVLKPCVYLAAENPAVGMTVSGFMERAMFATGDFPVDDSTFSPKEVIQACSAINRNFESCQADLGCVSATT